MRSWLIAIVLAALPLTARAQEPDEPARCFDVAVVARLVRETPGPYPDLGPDEIVMRWTWVLEFETEEVVVGRVDRQRLRVAAAMHTNYNSQISFFLLLLRRDPERGYVASDIIVRVVRDRRGRFIIPFERPADDSWLRPDGWLPARYESYLRPVRYGDAWWLTDLDETDLDELAETPPGWHTRRDGQVMALRGLYVSDLQRMMAQEPGAICDR